MKIRLSKYTLIIANIFIISLLTAAGQQKGTVIIDPSFFLIYAKNSAEIKNQYITSEPILKTFLSSEKFKSGDRYGVSFCYFLENNLGVFIDFSDVTIQYFHEGSIEFDTHTEAVDLIQEYKFRSYGVGLRKSCKINNLVSLQGDYTFSYWQHINHSDGHLLTLKKSHFHHSLNAGLVFKLNSVFSLNPGIMAGFSPVDMASASTFNNIDFKPIFFGVGIKLQIKLRNKSKI